MTDLDKFGCVSTMLKQAWHCIRLAQILKSVTIEYWVYNPVADYKSAPHLRRDCKSRRTGSTSWFANPAEPGERDVIMEMRGNEMLNGWTR